MSVTPNIDVANSDSDFGARPPERSLAGNVGSASIPRVYASGMTTRPKTGKFDIAIAGGGPAGAIAALILSRSGAKVALVDAGRRIGGIEGAGLRLVSALRAHGIEVAGLGPLFRRTASWGGLPTSANHEHMLSRAEFDDSLRAQAADAGVTVTQGVIRRAGPGTIDCADGRRILAGLVLEARGRRAPVASGRLRGIPTVSIAAPSVHRQTGSKIRACDDGWTWSIGNEKRGWTQVSVDAASARHPDHAWLRLTGQPLPENARISGSELRLCAPDLNPSLPRLGDAAVAMDPLSGHGLFWALASALMAPPIAAALLDGQSALAARFYRGRVVATFERQARIGRDFYRAAGKSGHFWQARSAWPDDAPAEPEPPASAFVERRVIVRGGRLAEADVLVTPQDPQGAAFVCGVEVVPLLARLGQGPLPDRAGFAARVLPDTPPETAARIHDWLAERGIGSAPVPKQKEVTT